MTRAGNLSEVLIPTPDSEGGTRFVDRVDTSLLATSLGTPGQVLTLSYFPGRQQDLVATWQPTQTGEGVNQEIVDFLSGTNTTVKKDGALIFTDTGDGLVPQLTVAIDSDWVRARGDSEIRNPVNTFTQPALAKFKTALDSEIKIVSRTSLTGSPAALLNQNPTGISVNPITGVISLTYPSVFNVTSVTWGNGARTKDAYTDPGVVNTSTINFTFALSNDTFNVQSTDSIYVGSQRITGANLLALGISGTGGTYTIPVGYLDEATQTSSIVTWSVSLTTINGGVNSASSTAATQLMNTQPSNFNPGVLTVAFEGNQNQPYYDGTFNNVSWTFSAATGTPTPGVGVIELLSTSGGSTTLTQNGVRTGSVGGSFSADVGPYTAEYSGFAGTGTSGAGQSVYPLTVINVPYPPTYAPYFVWDDINIDVSTITVAYLTGRTTSTTAASAGNLNISYTVTDITRTAYFATVRTATQFTGNGFVFTPAQTGTLVVPGRAGLASQTYNIYKLGVFGAPTGTRTFTVTLS